MYRENISLTFGFHSGVLLEPNGSLAREATYRGLAGLEEYKSVFVLKSMRVFFADKTQKLENFQIVINHGGKSYFPNTWTWSVTSASWETEITDWSKLVEGEPYELKVRCIAKDPGIYRLPIIAFEGYAETLAPVIEEPLGTLILTPRTLTEKGTLRFENKTKRVFTGRSLCFDVARAKDFELLDARVDGKSQLASASAVAATCFTKDTYNGAMMLDDLLPGKSFEIDVRCVSAEDGEQTLAGTTLAGIYV